VGILVDHHDCSLDRCILARLLVFDLNVPKESLQKQEDLIAEIVSDISWWSSLRISLGWVAEREPDLVMSSQRIKNTLFSLSDSNIGEPVS